MLRHLLPLVGTESEISRVPTFPPAVTMTGDPTPTDFGLSTDTGLAQYHTVTKGDTLYALARHYYSNQRRWKEIYEANRGRISDPNRIHVGQRLVIP